MSVSEERQWLDHAVMRAVAAAGQKAWSGAGSTVVVHGTFGSGRTSLLRTLAADATAAGICRGTAYAHFHESGIQVGTVSRLVESLANDLRSHARDEAASGWPGILDGLVAEAGQDPNTWYEGAGCALYRSLSELSRQRPLLLCVDDLQWADATSLRWLGYLARRMADLPLLLVATVRDGERGADLADVAELEDPRVCAASVRLAPMSAAATAAALRARRADADDRLCQQCHQASGGNRLLVSEAVAVVDGRVGEAGTPAERLARATCRPALRARFAADLARLAPAAPVLARTLAVLDDPCDPVLLAAITGLSGHDVADGLTALCDAGYVTGGPAPQFVHPLVRTSIAADVPATVRAGLHGTAARLLRLRVAPREQIVRHLLQAAPGSAPWAGETLLAAVRETIATQGRAKAVPLLGRALQESLAPQTRIEVLTELGRAHLGRDLAVSAGFFDEARALAAGAGAGTAAGRGLAVTLFHLGRAEESRSVLELLAEDCRDAEESGRAQALHALFMASRAATAGAAVGVLDRLSGPRPALAAADPLVRGLIALWCGGPSQDVVECLENVRSAGFVPVDEVEHVALFVCMLALLCADEMGYVEQWCSQAAAADPDGGDRLSKAVALLMRAQANLLRGRLAPAESDAAAAAEHMVRIGADPAGLLPRLALVTRVEAVAETGDAAAALSALAAADALGPVGDSWADTLLLGVRASVRIAVGDAAGERDLAECERLMATWPRDFGPIVIWRARAATLEFRLGHLDRARYLAGTALNAAQAWGSDRGVGAALYALGVISERPLAVEHLTAAVRVLSGTPDRLTTASAHVQLGAILRRGNQRHRARKHLREGLVLSQSCGAAGLVTQARDELRAAGGRHRNSVVTAGGLTGGEERVAALVCEGLSNAEIAARLFVARRTVEAHLTRIYRKVGVSGRGELREAMPSGCGGPGAPDFGF